MVSSIIIVLGVIAWNTILYESSDTETNSNFTPVEATGSVGYLVNIKQPARYYAPLSNPNNIPLRPGEKNYVINYIYSIGRDTGRGYDELFFNLIGHGWDTTISNITFNITMPESFDESMLSFLTGRRGSMSSENIEYSVNNRVIAGRLIGTLQPGEALAVRLELPDGYFEAATHNNSDFRMWVPLLPTALTAEVVAALAVVVGVLGNISAFR